MLKRLLCPKLPGPNQRVLLPENEAIHATRVLRLRNGEEVEVLDGRGNHLIGRLKMGEQGVQIEYVREVPKPENAGTKAVVPVVLEMAILKGDAMEWVVEKATELGVKKLIPVVTDHTVIQIRAKGPKFFQERWQKIADQALKQCGRLEALKVEIPIEFQELVKIPPAGAQLIRFWCDEEKSQGGAPSLAQWISKNTLNPTLEVRVLVGPEGGWSQNERKLLSQVAAAERDQAVPVSLGPLVLRAETAALSALSLVTSFVRAGL